MQDQTAEGTLSSNSLTYKFLKTSSMADEAEPGFTRSHLEEGVELLLHLLRKILRLPGAWACSCCPHAHGAPGAGHSPRPQGCKASEPCRQLRVHGNWRHLRPRLSRQFTGESEGTQSVSRGPRPPVLRSA